MSDFIPVSTKHLVPTVRAILKSGRIPVLWGPAGIGKTDMVNSLAPEFGGGLWDLPAANLMPSDLMGLPVADLAAGVAKFIQLGMLPTDPMARGVLFADEISNVSLSMQGALFRLLLARKLGDYTVPPGVVIAAAGNRMSDRGAAQRMSHPMGNRLVHIIVEVDAEAWCSWAVRANLHPGVIGAVRFKGELLTTAPADVKGEIPAFASPRSMHILSDVLKTGELPPETELAVIGGTVGPGVAAEIMGYMRDYRDLPSFAEIIKDPDGARVPANGSARFAVVTMLAQGVRRFSEKGDARLDKVIAGAFKYIDRVDADFGVIFVRDVVDVKAVTSSPAFARYVSRNSAVLGGDTSLGAVA